MRCFAILVVLLATTSSTATAQVFPLRITTRECDLTDCQTYIVRGSAVYLGQTRDDAHVFLTAEHNISPVSPHAILIESRRIELGVGKRWISASHIRSKRDKGIDLSLLKVYAQLPRVECLPITKPRLSPKAGVSLVGYTHTGNRLVINGEVTQSEFVNYPLAVNQRPVYGQSGGAVVHNGNLAGIIRGFPATTQPLCLYTNAEGIREFLRESLRHDPLCVPLRSLKQPPASTVENSKQKR